MLGFVFGGDHERRDAAFVNGIGIGAALYQRGNHFRKSIAVLSGDHECGALVANSRSIGICLCLKQQFCDFKALTVRIACSSHQQSPTFARGCHIGVEAGGDEFFERFTRVALVENKECGSSSVLVLVVHVGARFDEGFQNVRLFGELDGKRQGMPGSIRGGFVDIGAGINQCLDDAGGKVVAKRSVQIGPAILVSGLDIDASLHEQRNACRAVVESKKQCVLAARVGGMRIGLVGKQQFDDVRGVVSDSLNEKRLSVFVGGVRVGASLQKRRDDRQIWLARVHGMHDGGFAAFILRMDVGSGGDQCVNNRSPVLEHGSHERRSASPVGSVDIGAVFGKKPDEVSVSLGNAPLEQIIDFLGGNGFDVASCGGKRAECSQIAVLGGDGKRSRPVGGLGIEIGARLDEELEHFGRHPAVPRGKHERGAAVVVLGVDFGAGGDQQCHDVLVAVGFCGQHEGREAGVGRRVDFGSCINERLGDLGELVVGSRSHQGRDAALCRLVDPGAGLEQRLDDLWTLAAGGSGQKRGLPVFAFGLDIGAGIEQSLNGFKRVVCRRCHEGRFLPAVAGIDIGPVLEGGRDVFRTAFAAKLMKIRVAHRGPGGQGKAHGQECAQ